MKKFMMNNRLLVAALAISALTACNNETNEDGLDGRTPLAVTGSSIAESRATDNAWEKKDAIGVTLFEAGTSNIVLDNPKAGKYITAQGNGAFEPADKANTLYYPTQNKKADIVAFYPYANLGADLKVPVNVANQTKLSAIDLMVADKVKGKSAADGEVSLTFRHKLVKIDLSIDCTQSAADVDLSKATVALHGTPATAEWSLSAGTLKTGAAATIDIPTVYKGNKLTATAIVIPCDVKGVKLVVIVGNHAYDVPFTEKMLLAAGTKNTLRVHLERTAAIVEASVADWTTGVSSDLNLVLRGITDGTVTYAANEGDILNVYYNTVSTDAVQGSFKYENNAWTSNTPLYWDEIAQTGYTGQFIAVLTPAAKTTPFADFFVGTATGVTFGSEVSFTLQHAAAQFSFVIKAGTGIDDINTEVPTRTITLGEGDATGMNADGTINYGTLTNKNYTIGTEALFVTPQTLADSHVVTLTRANGNKYTVKLTDLMNGTDKLFTGGKVEAGKHYTITLTVNESTVGITAGIADWTDVEGSGTAKPEF